MCVVAPVISIDGPGGVGKGTVAGMLATRLGWHVLDSGAIYRSVAWLADRQRCDPEDERALVGLTRDLDVRCNYDPVLGETRILLADEDISDKLRSEVCGDLASRIATAPLVRKSLLDRQRAFCRLPGLVADGRDMGTVVFPQATLKVYLVASPEERAKRRHRQLKRRGVCRSLSLSRILDDMTNRDVRDRGRAVSPLHPADDALLIDTNRLSASAVCEMILNGLFAVAPEFRGDT